MLSKVVTGAEGLERACSASLKQALCNLQLIPVSSWVKAGLGLQDPPSGIPHLARKKKDNTTA